MSPSDKPFDEERYKALMDGLECNEVLLSNTRVENPVFRFDAEYFNKEVLSLVTRIKTKTNRLISSSFIVSKLAGFEFTEYFTPKNMSSNDCYIALTSKNVHQNQLDLNECITIDRRVADVFLKRSSLKKNDVVLSYTGEYRRALTLFDGGYQLGPNVCRLTPIDRIINPHYLSVFLNSAVGQKILDREKTLSAQPTVAMSRIRAIRVPVFSKLQIEIEKLITISNTAQGKAGKLVGEAVEVLDRELDIKSVQTSTISIKTLKDSFEVTGRLDAEYYQPKYDEYLSLIANYKNGYSIIKDEFLPIREICDRSLAEYQYVEIGDVDIGTGSASYNTIATDDLPDNAKIITQKNDVLVSTVRPNRGAVAILEDNDLLVSSAFTVLRERGTYKKEVLQVLLRLPLYRDWLLRYNVGTSYPVIKDDDVLNMPIPLFEDAVQKEITAKVQESFALRRQSKQLLEYAKQAVEMAIETDENIAMNWLQAQI